MILLIFILVLALFYGFLTRKKRLAYQRVLLLCEQNKTEIDWSLSKKKLTLFSDRFGKAGFFTVEARAKFYAVLALVFISLLFLTLQMVKNFYFSLVVAVYFSILGGLIFLRLKTKDQEREILFRLPLFLESLILLVESGLGVLPAVQRVVESSKRKNEPVGQVMRAVYELSSSGLPFAQSLELVASSIESNALRHVLLHLDVSSTEGGALIPSLRSLADHAGREWKLGVEARVKRLENIVVFPVFASVLGLMLLVVAVPIVPVIDFFSGLQKESRFESINNRLGESK